MQDFIAKLDALKKANNAAERKACIKAANKSLKKIQALSGDEIRIAVGLLNPYSNEFGTWVNDIPYLLTSSNKKLKKKAQKYLAPLIDVVATKARISKETREELIEEINRCQSSHDLSLLKNGKTQHEFELGNKKLRLVTRSLRDRALKVGMTPDEFDIVYKERANYLQKKKTADRFALVLNATLSVLGIGLICGIALMAILPAMPLVAFIPTLIAFSLLGGYVEGFVYHGFVQNFCRNMVRGFFESVENNVLNRVYGKEKWHSMSADEQKAFLKENHAVRMTEELYRDLGRKRWQTLTVAERKQKLSQHPKELFFKKLFVIATIPIAIASGVGFSALAFTQLLSILPMMGVAAGSIIGIAAPWALAAIVGPMYAMVMYSMLHKAIKNNIFVKMKENIVDLFANKDNRHPVAHVALCALKVVGLVFILAISVAATIFTAGTWLESSVAFFAAAVGLVDLIATKVGLAIGGVFLATGLWFSLEKSLETTKALIDFSPKEFVKPFSSPANFAIFCVQAILFGIHVVGTGAVAALGTDVFEPLVNLIGNFWTKLIAVVVGTVEEVAVDAKDYTNAHAHSHLGDCSGAKHHHHHGHSHGNLVKDVKEGFTSFGKSVHSLFAGSAKKAEQDAKSLVKDGDDVAVVMKMRK